MTQSDDETTMTVAGAGDIWLLRTFVERHEVNGFLRNSRGGEVVFVLGADDGEILQLTAWVYVLDPALADAVERELRLILNVKD